MNIKKIALIIIGACVVVGMIVAGTLLLSKKTSLDLSTLASITKYSTVYPEFPPIDNKDYSNPDYTTYYNSIQTNSLTTLLSVWGLAKPAWNVRAFQKTLKHITQERMAFKLSKSHVTNIQVKGTTQCYLWGHIHGEFHSLARCLSYLHGKGVISDTLELKNPNDYIIFMGDLIDRSAYNLETLHVVINLMNKNPNHVIYIKGKHETDEYWHNYSTRDEIRIRGQVPTKKASSSITSLLTKFFDTLPLALYINCKDAPLDMIRLSFLGREDKLVNEKNLSDSFADPNKPPMAYFNLYQRSKPSWNAHIHAIIKYEDWIRESRAMKGLSQLEQDQGTTAWSIVSTPIMLHQLYFNLFYDSFAQLTIQTPITDSTITSYSNDIRSQDGFQQDATYNIATGLQVAAQTTEKKPIMLGSTMALKHGLGPLGQNVKRGISTRILKENSRGGVDHQLLKAIILNDNYIPNKARKNVLELLDHHIDTILHPVGSPTLHSYLDLIKEHKVLVLFPVTGSQFNEKGVDNIVYMRPTYIDEVDALIETIIKEYGVRKFAFFYQYDNYEEEPIPTAHKALQRNGINEWLDLPYTRGSIDFKDQAQKIKLMQPDAIGFFATSKPSQELIRQIGIESLTSTKLFGISMLGDTSFRRFTQSRGLECFYGSAVPNPRTSNLAIVKEYREVMDEYHYQYDIFSLESYIGTSVVIEAMKNIKGPITMQAIREQLESLKDFSYKGLLLNFDPVTRNLATSVWIEMGSGEWQKRPLLSVQHPAPETKKEEKIEKPEEPKTTK